MDLEKMLKNAYMSGVIEAQIAEQVSNMNFDFDGMANTYAQNKVKELNISNEKNNEINHKPIEQILSDAIKDSYDKIKNNLEPPL